jgi:hypothetical protein
MARHEERLRQLLARRGLAEARERGEDIGWDGLFGVPGTRREGLLLTVLIVAAIYLVSPALIDVDPLWMALAIAGLTSLIANRTAGWMVAPYAHSAFRRLLWGLTTAALLLLMVRVGLAVALLIHLRLDGVGAEAAGIAAFKGGSALHPDDRHAGLAAVRGLGLAAPAITGAGADIGSLAALAADRPRPGDDGLPGTRGRLLRPPSAAACFTVKTVSSRCRPCRCHGRRPSRSSRTP